MEWNGHDIRESVESYREADAGIGLAVHRAIATRRFDGHGNDLLDEFERAFRALERCLVEFEGNDADETSVAVAKQLRSVCLDHLDRLETDDAVRTGQTMPRPIVRPGHAPDGVPEFDGTD